VKKVLYTVFVPEVHGKSQEVMMKEERGIWSVAAMVFVAYAVLCASSYGAPQSKDDGWEKINDGKLCGISGMESVSANPTTQVFLIAHDNKNPDEQKLALLTLRKGQKTEYAPVTWPKNASQPVDIEALCRVPGTDDAQFLAATSKGTVFHLRLAKDGSGVEIIKELSYPSRGKMNFEGLGLILSGQSLAAVWAHRGKGSSPGVLFWGSVDLAKGEVNTAGSKPLHVPWPTGNDLRSVSDLKLDKNGRIYVSSASDPGDDGPFSSALYDVGQIAVAAGKPVVQLQSRAREIERLPGHKVEGIVLLSEDGTRFLVGTDDENSGSSIRTVDTRPSKSILKRLR
jgi:hypothetical protein